MKNLRIIDASYCVVDFETTGGNYLNDKIIEIGAVKIINLKIADKFHQIINPLRKIPYRVTKITGINNDMVQGEPILDDVLPSFLDFIKNCIWVEHSLNWFDFNFFTSSVDFRRNILRINTHELSRKFLGAKEYDLISIAYELGIDISEYPREKHNALTDSIITSNIFIKLCSILENNGIIYISDLINKGLIHEYRNQ